MNFWSDAGNAPGAPIATANVISYSEEATGREWFGRQEAESWADFDAIHSPSKQSYTSCGCNSCMQRLKPHCFSSAVRKHGWQEIPLLSTLKAIFFEYGPVNSGIVGPNNASTGVPSAVDRCMVPVSTETRQWAFARTCISVAKGEPNRDSTPGKASKGSKCRRSCSVPLMAMARPVPRLIRPINSVQCSTGQLLWLR